MTTEFASRKQTCENPGGLTVEPRNESNINKEISGPANG